MIAETAAEVRADTAGRAAGAIPEPFAEVPPGMIAEVVPEITPEVPADVPREGTARPAAGAATEETAQPPEKERRSPSVGLVPGLAPTPDRPVDYGGHTLLAQVARGGMAEIFVATPAGGAAGELCAIKRLYPHLADSPRTLERFDEEARVTAGLRHDNVVKIHATERDRWGLPYMVMEYLPGASLKGLIRASLGAGRMPPIPVSVWIVAQTCRALHHAHTVGVDGEPVIHGDVSPENVLVTYSGAVKLLDFGAAQVLQPDHLDGAAGPSVLGKLSYMAPEQAFGEALGPAADQFSVGVMLYEAVTGRRAFARHRTIDALRAALRRPLPPPRSINPGIPQGLDRIVVRACSLRPGDRYPSCGAMAEELDRFLADASITMTTERLGRHMQEVFAPEFRAFRVWLRDATQRRAPRPTRLSPPAPEEAPVLPVVGVDEEVVWFTGVHPRRRSVRSTLLVAAGLGLLLALALTLVDQADRSRAPRPLGSTRASLGLPDEAEADAGVAAPDGGDGLQRAQRGADAEPGGEQDDPDEGHGAQHPAGQGAEPAAAQAPLSQQREQSGAPGAEQHPSGHNLDAPPRQDGGRADGQPGQQQVH